MKGILMKYNYRELCKLNMDSDTELYLVRQLETGLLAVRRTVDKDLYTVYKKLIDIQHPNLMRIIEAELQGEVCSVIEEYISGETLGERLMRGELFEKDEAVYYLRMLCGAVCELHENGLVHRDITPGNIMLTNDGILKLCDYDISRFYKQERRRDTQILGTQGYAAPEQFGYGQTGICSDIYSIGRVANVMLTGQENVLYHGDKRLMRLIARATATDPGHRQQSVRELEEELTMELHGGYGRIRTFLRSIPGFRTWKPWKMILAVILYPYLIYVNIFIFGAYVNNAVAAVITFVIPWILYLDLFYVSKRLLKLDYGQKWFRIVIGLSIQLGVLYSMY